MRTCVAWLCALAVLGSAARADLLRLSNGGELKGTLTEITFRVRGTSTAHPGDKVRTLVVHRATRDELTLRDGKKLEGTLVAVKFKSVGGLLTLDREKVAAVRATGDPLASARKELETRKKQIKLDDAGALCQLADWCLRHRLKADAAELARAALKADTDGPHAAKAHALLGHVRHKGEWMTLAERAKRRQAEGNDAAGPADPKPAPEGRKDIQTALAKNADLLDAYSEHAEEKTKEIMERVEEKHGESWRDVTGRLREALKQCRAKLAERELEMKRTRLELQRQNATYAEIERHIESQFTDEQSPWVQDIQRLKGEALRIKREQSKLGAVIKKYRARAAKIEADRKARLKLIHQRNRRLLLAGTLLELGQMTDAYDQVFADE